MRYIVCGTMDQSRSWASQNAVSMQDVIHVGYGNSPHKLYGLRGYMPIVRLPSHYTNPARGMIEAIIERQQRKNSNYVADYREARNGRDS